MSTTTYNDTAVAGTATRRDAHEVLGQVMGLVAVTVGFTALGAYLGRDLSGAAGLVLFVGSFATIFGLDAAVSRGRRPLAVGLLFGLGLLLGLAIAPVIAGYASADPSALWQAADEKLAQIAEGGINQQAADAAHPQDEEEEEDDRPARAGRASAAAVMAKRPARRSSR